MEYIYEHRRGNTWWGLYDWYYGNLTGMAHLESVRKFRSIEEYPSARPTYNANKDKILYLQGDSNTRHPKLKVADFAGLADFHYLERSFDYQYHLDTTKKNILILSISETRVLDYFKDLKMLEEVRDSADKKQVLQPVLPPNIDLIACSFISGLTVDVFFNKFINQNLECNLFNYNLLMPLYSYKAAINYYLFRRASGDVVISNDGNCLFYKETVSATHQHSVYRTLPKEETDKLIDNLNSIYRHFRQVGFKEVYLSVIPSTATILQPEGYNGLIPILENNRHMEMKLLSMYDAFKGHSDYYLSGDVHWTDIGFRKWLGIMNEQLMKD